MTHRARATPLHRHLAKAAVLCWVSAMSATSATSASTVGTAGEGARSGFPLCPDSALSWCMACHSSSGADAPLELRLRALSRNSSLPMSLFFPVKGGQRPEQPTRDSLGAALAGALVDVDSALDDVKKWTAELLAGGCDKKQSETCTASKKALVAATKLADSTGKAAVAAKGAFGKASAGSAAGLESCWVAQPCQGERIKVNVINPLANEVRAVARARVCVCV